VQNSEEDTKATTPRFLPLTTMPWRLPPNTTGLSLYFMTLLSLLVLMLIFSLLTIPALYSNLEAKNFSKQYALWESTTIEINAGASVVSSRHVATCEHTYQVRHIVPRPKQSYPNQTVSDHYGSRGM
jgi:hypothetical protein